MRKRLGVGVWELFVPGIGAGELYKYEIIGVHGEVLPLKSDPIAKAHEVPPSTASVVCGYTHHDWQDGPWLSRREAQQRADKPISIYEVHLGSWKRTPDGEMLDYDTLDRKSTRLNSSH